MVIAPEGVVQPKLSWRVHILPFLGENELYDKFHLNESWNSDHNRSLIDDMPEVFRGATSEKKGTTPYVLPALANGFWGSAAKQPKRSEITDGTSKTMMMVHAASVSNVIWTEPADLKLSNRFFHGELFENRKTIYVCLFDGAVIKLSRNLSSEMLHRLLTHEGGEDVEWRK